MFQALQAQFGPIEIEIVDESSEVGTAERIIEKCFFS